MKWYTFFWSLIFAYLCAIGFVYFLDGRQATTNVVFVFVLIVASLEYAFGGAEKIIRYRLGKKRAISELLTMLQKHSFPTEDHRRLRNEIFGGVSGPYAELYFRAIAKWTTGWDRENPIPEYVLLSRDWVTTFDRLAHLSMTNMDAYAVDRFSEVGDEAVRQHLSAGP
jgi:hypothetical protein